MLIQQFLVVGALLSLNWQLISRMTDESGFWRRRSA
ncbi:UNVERIFIED_CONTAM: hypothetical protein ABIC26_003720 [Paenibacillus sp. PvR008]